MKQADDQSSNVTPTDAVARDKKRPYEAPVLQRHGTVAGITKLYLQSKLPGTKDTSQSGRGAGK